MEQSNETTATAAAGTEIGNGQGTGTQSTTASIDSSPKADAITQAAKPAEGQATEAAPFSPNWKFNVHDKDYEVEEWLRPVVKDAETEKKIKELYTQAYGLEPVKASRERLQKEHEELKSNYSSLYNDVYEAMSYKQQGDLGGFFQKVGLTDEDVAKYMLEKINRQQLPPEQQRVYNELEAKRKAELYQARQLEELQTQNRTMASQQREWEVDQWLARPDVSSIAERYDASNGRGSFKRFVAEVGVMHHSMYGEDPTVEQAVGVVLKRLGDAYKSQPAPVSQAPQNNQEKPLPVIPNVSGKNVSPTRKALRSVDDLRKLSEEARA